MVKMSYEKLVDECKRLRLKGERAVAEGRATLPQPAQAPCR